MAQPKYKPLSFTTTLRNPERMPSFLKCLIPFEGKTLTKDVIHNVVKSVIREKIYKPTGIGRNNLFNAIWKDEDSTFSDTQLERIIIENPQNHKEFGFDKGWDSRFDTWFKIFKELGFANYNMNEKIVITQTGHMLVDAYSETPSNYLKVQRVYLNALMKYQTNNPLRKILNEQSPLSLLLRVIKLFHDDPEENDAGLARHELPILICWIDNDAEAAYRYIKQIRCERKFSCSDEYIYEHCLAILHTDNRNYIKMDKICHETIDEYIRKMRMTGLISLRGNGRFVDINKFEEAAADYVIEHYSSYEKFNTIDSFIAYMGQIDTHILEIEEVNDDELYDARQRKLKECASSMTKEYVFNELRNVCSKKESKDEVLRFIPAPTRLEFLTSISLVQNFDTLDVRPNYPVDDEGYPVSTAAGGFADIECFDNDYDSYYEVSLMCGRSDQVNNEIIPISRHLQEAIQTRRAESFAVFIAPSIHQDTYEACDWQKHKNNVDIVPYNVNEFIIAICSSTKARQLLNKTTYDNLMVAEAPATYGNV